MLFGIESVLMSRKDLISNLSTFFFFENQKKTYYGDEATDITIKKFIRWTLIILV